MNDFRFGAGPDVQRRVGSREPSSGRRVQAAAERGLRHIREHVEEAASDVEKNGYRHGTVDGHVEAHVASGGPQDDGRDEEGRWLGCTSARQLHRQNSGSREFGPLR